LDSDHLPIIFHILDHVKIRNLSDPIEKFTDWEWFQSLASELISPKIEVTSEAEADKGACDFTASISPAYRLSTSKITLLDLNNDLPGLDRLLKHKERLRKLWQETRDPACTTAVNWVSKAIRRMTHKKALERWETKVTLKSNQRLYGLLRSPSLRGMDQGNQLLFMVLQASNFICPRKLTQLLTVWKFSSRHMSCVTKTMNGGWRLKFKLY
jgi:hypothetical protein